MSAHAVADRPLLFGDPPQPTGRTSTRGRSSERSGGGRLTLERRLDGVWEGLRADGAADCPVCEGPLAIDAGGSTARCGDCGSRLR